MTPWLDPSLLPPWQLALLVFGVAFFYSSVGFGGASGYLAAMSLFALAPQFMASTALILNVVVSSVAFVTYYRAGHFSFPLLWPFLLTSVPAAFVGGFFPVNEKLYLILLYGALAYVGLRLLVDSTAKWEEAQSSQSISYPWALIAGTGIGLFSGILGLGGGIFLSPIIVLARWGTSKQAANVCAAFILVNSVSGLAGRVVGGNFLFGLMGAALLPLGLAGAMLGSRLGAHTLNGSGVRRLLGAILLLAALRFVLG